MYTHDSEVIGNLSQGNHIGFALMYGDRMRVEGNRSVGDGEHGLMFNYANASMVSGNVVERGEDRCVFLFNANKNTITRNRFEGCDTGIYFTAGSARNQIYENALIGNRTQVKYVGTRLLDWSKDGRGNYWSDNAAYDLDQDGIADQAYKPNDLMDEVVWRAPLARALLSSPAVQVLRWAQARFPALHPGGVIDSAPLMAPPAIPKAPAPMEAAG
jgi:nitrous oxidase accessory protein